MTLSDVIRWGASALARAGLSFAQHADNALDESRELVLHSLNLPHDFPANFAQAKLLPHEVAQAQHLIARRIQERIPAAYLTGSARFAGMSFFTDVRALIPRSPIAELIQQHFRPLLRRSPARALDLCTGSGAIGIAIAAHFVDTQVDLADISSDALTLARSNVERHRLASRVRCIESDLFNELDPKRSFDLIVSNPPYVTESEFSVMAAEFMFEPKLGLVSGQDGLDITLRILRDCTDFLTHDGVLIVEVGDAERALRRLLPALALHWINFDVGNMGVFAVTRAELLQNLPAICQLCAVRGP